ncbi:MAG: hypothetical protein NVS2B9_10030 [Myxococcales bacterium]
MRVAAAAALLLASCATYYDPCFAPQGQVRDLRVLGLRADPPEARADLVSGAVGQVSVSVLLGAPDPAIEPLRMTASLCSPTEDRRCPEAAPVVARVSGYPTASFAVDAPVALLRDALAADPLRGYGGLRLQLDLRVGGPSGAILARASKLLIYALPDPAHVLNHGLEIPALRILREGAAPQDLKPGDRFPLNVGDAAGLRPLLAPGPGGSEAAETYTVTDLSGRLVSRREQITYSFFVTPHNVFGRLINGVSTPGADKNAQADVADEPAFGTPDPTGGLVRVTSVNASLGQLWVVARDGRGGEAWIAVTLVSEDLRGQAGQLEFDCR